VLDHAANIAADCQVLGRDFDVVRGAENWQLKSGTIELKHLPMPVLQGEFQLDNAATAIMALAVLQGRLVLSTEHYAAGLRSASLAGRFELLADRPQIIADVAHNTQAVTALCSQLQASPCAGKTRVVIAMLADKPVAAVIETLKPLTDVWYSAGLDSVGRGMTASTMEKMIQHALADAGDAKLYVNNTVVEACAAALHDASPEDRIVVLGSFYTVAAAKQFFAQSATP
jgi:dihydrofolate synthase/folylpolyglutamate synthase